MKNIIFGLVMMGLVPSVFALEHCERMNVYNLKHQTIWKALSEFGALGGVSLPISGGVLVNNLWQIQLHEKDGVIFIANALHDILVEKYGVKSNSGKNDILDLMDQSIKNKNTVCDFANQLIEKYTF
jgi:hypothetical protein